MACVTVTHSFGFRCHLFRSPSPGVSHGSVHFAPFNKANSLKLSWSSSICGFGSLLPQKLCTVVSQPQKLRPLIIVSAKGYTMKSHKATAKRFRVTGQGSIYWLRRTQKGNYDSQKCIQ